MDIEGARKAGYSDAEIAEHMAKSSGFDLAGARSSGYSDADDPGTFRNRIESPSDDLAHRHPAEIRITRTFAEQVSLLFLN
jgi:hypothetical protein